MSEDRGEHRLSTRLRDLADNIGTRTTGTAESDDIGRVLPAEHRALLEGLNGFTVHRGAFRIFGIGRESALDLGLWNDRETWRFAWPRHLDQFLFFGGTAWGDQYAYRWGSSGHLAGPEVFFLEANSMGPEPFAESFEQFVVNDLLRNARDPYDTMTVAALASLGAIAPGDHWALAPSVALGGYEDIANVMTLPSSTAMIIAGDIDSALRGMHPGTRPSAVVPWTDDRGRLRLRLDSAAAQTRREVDR